MKQFELVLFPEATTFLLKVLKVTNIKYFPVGTGR